MNDKPKDYYQANPDWTPPDQNQRERAVEMARRWVEQAEASDAGRGDDPDLFDESDTSELCYALLTAHADLALARKEKDGAYRERDALVCALSKIFPAWLATRPESDTTWDHDWRTIVFIMLPTGQASWHIHDSEVADFDHLQRERNCWDGHTTEEKYNRLSMMTSAGARAALEPAP